MIQINLLPGPKKKRGAAFRLPDFGELLSSVKDPMLMVCVVVLAAAAVFIGGLWVLERGRVEAIRPEVQQLRVEHRNFRTLIAEKRRMENLRDSLLRELEAIREIDRDRYVWPHILEEVSRALPDFTWLVNMDFIPAPPPLDGVEEVGPPPVRFSIEGRTSEIQGYTRFFRRLGDSPWLTDLQFGATQTVQEADRAITSFQIEATFRFADSSFIRTVPVTESVR